MPKTIPIIITNDCILVKEKESTKFVTFNMPGIEAMPNIPFYHMFAGKISECQYYFKEFMLKLYGKKVSEALLGLHDGLSLAHLAYDTDAVVGGGFGDEGDTILL